VEAQLQNVLQADGLRIFFAEKLTLEQRLSIHYSIVKDYLGLRKHGDSAETPGSTLQSVT